MKFTFNIIYTTGFVKYLSLFIFSLLKWSDCSFRLVANGCSSEEKRLLQTICHKNARLEFLTLPSKHMMKHGDALDYLQSLEQSDYFCFMDSDILATGEFLREFILSLDQSAGVFSGFPIWCNNEEHMLPETSPGMFGRHYRTTNGLCIGSTYFAMYHNKILTQVLRATAMSFNKYQWQDIPTQYQNQFMKMGLKHETYDTGKVLNLLLLVQGESLVFKEVPSLKHIGGISACFALEHGFHWNYLQYRTFKKKILAWLFEGKFRRTLMTLAGIKEAKIPRLEITDDLLRSHPNRNRFMSYCYFTQLLQALFEHRPLPALPDMGSAEVEKKVEMLTKDIINFFKEFREQLPVN